MLEKIGLPPKPSQRGNNWVVDASHCQGCSSQFTFINRKHHCRRCGGLLCNSCTSQRMVLRGQGDSPVRICQPCKTLEEAARFELRYGNRTRAAKASIKPPPKSEDDILSDVLGHGKNKFLAPGMGSSSKTVSSIERATSLISQDKASIDGGEEVNRSASLDVFDGQATEKEPTSPDDLRRQAVEEKKKYKVLKGDGKSDEALRAFKRGKELERQADALEISVRKSRRKALVSQNVEEGSITNNVGGSRRGNKVARVEGKEKDDLAAELRELGWSDMDLQSEDKKKTNTSLEGEFSSLLGEVSEKTKTGKGGNLGTEKSKVLALKKRAIELKREGNLAEAKEELKRAKVLEKQLEEQELLAGADDSDDELSALLRSLDSDNQDLSVDQYEQRPDFDISSLLVDADQIMNNNFDVTEEDMEDPEIAAALNSLGWANDDQDSNVPVVDSVDKEALSKEILSLKREALTQKRAGNVSEAMSLLKKAKLLGKDLEISESREVDFTKDSTSQAASHSSSQTVPSDESVNAVERFESKPALRKSKLMVQKELISLKKKALALKREGRLEEAEEELKKGKVIEQQLEEMDKAPPNAKPMPVSTRTKPSNLAYDNLPGGDTEDENVTDQDMNDPSYLSLLKNLGWQEEHNDLPANISADSRKMIDSPPVPVSESVVARPQKNRAELQRELLGLKRRALALRRQGESEEAEEVSRKAKDIEDKIAELEHPTTEVPQSVDKNHGDAEMVTEKDMHDPTMLSGLKDLGWNDGVQETLAANEISKENASTPAVYSDATSVTVKRSKGEIQRELLNLKRRGLVLRRKGDIEEAEELQNMAKVLEAQLEELEAPKQQVYMQETAKGEKQNNFGPPSNSKTGRGSIGSDTANLGILTSDLLIPLNSSSVESTAVPPPPGNSENLIDLLTGDYWDGPQISAEKPIVNEPNPINEHASVSSNNDMGTEKLGNIAKKGNPSEEHASPKNETTLKQEILARRRKALAFKREGKLAEAREELRQAKLLEKRGSQNDTEPTTSPEPTPAHESVAGSSSIVPPKPLSGRDRFKLQQESLAHKRQAMKLRREGRAEEADAEFELAKSLEARLEESAPNDEAEADGDNLGVEDFLDPQLLSALRAIGIDDTRAAPPILDRPQPSRPTAITTNDSSDSERRAQLEEQIKAEKLKAIHLKRSGKQAEALGVLRNAKLLEKKLNFVS